MTSVPRLHLIGPLDVVRPAEYATIAVRAARGGCDAVHLRIPEFAGGDFLRIALSIKRELSLVDGSKLIVNDRLDVAYLAGSDGVQLGERSFDVPQARRIVGTGALVGRSIHGIDGAKRAEEDGASFVIAGHIFTTPSKEGEPGRGVDWLGEIAGQLSIPVIAIGGITVSNVPDVMEAGAHGVAVARELLQAEDPTQIARRIRQHFPED
ncbi:MAG: thiamine phosphate synthase [Chloroflexota bacterium]